MSRPWWAQNHLGVAVIEACAVPGEARYLPPVDHRASRSNRIRGSIERHKDDRLSRVEQLSAFGWNCLDSGQTQVALAPVRFPTAAIEMSPPTMNAEEEHQLREQLARLQQEHRDLDAAISALQDAPGSEEIQIQRLKKRKLQLRDKITFIEDQLTPDIIA